MLFRSNNPSLGLVASFARPDGNLTGFSIMAFELMPKQLEVLSDLVPEARVISLLANPNNPATEPIIRTVKEAAGAKGLQLRVLKAGTESEIDAAFATFVQAKVGALVVVPDPFMLARREQLTTLAARHVIPAIYAWREFVMAGGLISYGPSVTGTWRQLGDYAGKILNGTKPADLPVEQPTRFELVVNLKSANALSLTVPPLILARADEVIE